jgi:hypothetical protein
MIMLNERAAVTRASGRFNVARLPAQRRFAAMMLATPGNP